MNYKKQPRQSLPDVRERIKKSRQPWKVFMAILLVIIGFLAASQFISVNFPKTVSTLDIPALDRKLEDIKLNGSKYDFVFLGSSRVFRGINPVEIDAQARRQGCDIKTYNFGIAGLSILEQKYILDKLHASGIEIGTIVVEPYSVTIRDFSNFISDRRRYFYSWENLTALIGDQDTMPDNAKTKVRRKRLAYLLYGFLQEQTGFGRLGHMLFPRQSRYGGTWDSTISRGYKPLDEETARNFKRRSKQFVRRATKFEEEVKRASSNPEARKNSRNRFELVLGVTDKIRSMDMEPAILFMPKPAYIMHSRDLEDRLANNSTGDLPIINLNRPDNYKNLFKVDNFYDSSHLNARGATVLAGYLAPHLCELESSH
jgi:hypothetical protein